MKSQPAGDPAFDARPGREHLSRRSLLRGLVAFVVAAPVLKLSEKLARAEKYRRHHSGDDSGIWIGHC